MSAARRGSSLMLGRPVGRVIREDVVKKTCVLHARFTMRWRTKRVSGLSSNSGLAVLRRVNYAKRGLKENAERKGGRERERERERRRGREQSSKQCRRLVLPDRPTDRPSARPMERPTQHSTCSSITISIVAASARHASHDAYALLSLRHHYIGSRSSCADHGAKEPRSGTGRKRKKERHDGSRNGITRVSRTARRRGAPESDVYLLPQIANAGHGITILDRDRAGTRESYFTSIGCVAGVVLF